jgi:uncharacterized protein YbcI
MAAEEQVASPVEDRTYAEPPSTRVTGPVLAAISNEMVRVYKEQFGRGPTKVRTNFSGPDVIVCILEETFTPAERNLLAMGEGGRLRDTRLFFQHATETEFKRIVQDATGRQVLSFIGGIDVEHDVAAELFTLEPLASAGADALPSAR